MIVRVKICGITNIEDAHAAVEAGADALGFVFAKSPRRVTPAQARRIIDALPPFVTKVGVFVNEKEKIVKRIVKHCRLNAIQFHGDETPAYCRRFKGTGSVIKALRVKDKWVLKALRRCYAEAFLLDAYNPCMYGGTGAVFDWNLAKGAKKLGVPIILSGGLNPSNVEAAISQVRPDAVDVSSGVEKSPGRKDIVLLRRFIKNAKAEPEEIHITKDEG